MSYVKSIQYPNWIYDGDEDQYISPSGRLAEYPGAPFHGTLHKKEFALIKEQINENIIDKTTNYESESENVANQVTAEIVKTLTIGDITINWIKVS